MAPLVDLLPRAYREWRDARVIRLGAGLAYYALFAVVPLLVLSVAVAGTFFSRDDVEQAVADLFAGILGTDEAEASAWVTDLAAGIDAAQPLRGFGLVGLVGLLVTASLLFVALQDAVNVIWGVPYRAGLVQGTLRRRLVALAVVAGTAALLLAVLVLQTALGLVELVLPDGALAGPVIAVLDVIGSWGLLAGAAVLTIRSLSPPGVPWPVAGVAGVLVAAAMALGTRGLAFYLSELGGSSVGGAAGGVVAALTWLYVMAQVVLAGAVLAKVLTEARVAG